VKERTLLEDLGIDNRKILKQLKYDVRAYSGLIWLRQGKVSGCCVYMVWLRAIGLHKMGGIP
jgi:hypothetical protein